VNDSVQARVIDALDRRILRVVQRQGAISQADLAEQVGSSSASCWRRLKALEEDGILGDVVRLVDPAKVGQRLEAICQVRLKSHAAEVRSDFEAFARSHEQIRACYLMSGEWDYLVIVMSRDVQQFEHFLMREMLAHNSVATSASHFSLKCIKTTTEIPI
jgi:DNA-binding Lrp family transcriptional regulator